MKFLSYLYLILCATALSAEVPNVGSIVTAARATLGAESALEGVVTLKLQGWIEPTESKLPGAQVRITARKPCSQRLEVQMGDVVETTILDGDSGCVIRAHMSDPEQGSQMRALTAEEARRVVFDTRRLFRFYRADALGGEQIDYQGIEQRRGVRCHKLAYVYPCGLTTVRYFAVNDHTLVSTVTDQGVERVAVGARRVGGIQFPERVEFYQDGEMLHTLVIHEVSVNEPLKRGIFTLPTADQTK
jgi:hypothetical protein